MATTRKNRLNRSSRPRVATLSACIGWAIACASASESADTPAAVADLFVDDPSHPSAILVDNCNDAGAGSVREAMTTAVDGQLVDASGLTCGVITLATGQIEVPAASVTLLGPGRGSLTLQNGNGAKYTNRIFSHSGTGQLALQGVTLVGGTIAGSADSLNAFGGCVYSAGKVSLDQTLVKYCVAETSGTAMASGGAIYAKSGISLLSSTISGNESRSNANDSFGGGVFTRGSLFSKYSTIDHNNAVVSMTGYYGYGGAAWVAGDATVLNTTVNGNYADAAAGLDLPGGLATTTLQIGNVTVTDNTTYHSYFGAGVYIGNTATIANSTITGNVEKNPTNVKYGAGLDIKQGITVDIESTILSANSLDNGSGFLPSDINGRDGTAAITGANNLIGYSILPKPADTIVTLDPGLGSLATNGGPTATMMPLATSLAVNAGNNANNGKYDQRGPGYPRVVGANADIGAVETDVLFRNGFE